MPSLKSETTVPHLQAIVTRVSKALRKFVNATESNLRADCRLHTKLGRILLADFNIEAELVMGYVAWRVGNNAGDIVQHMPFDTDKAAATDELYFRFHAWLVYQHHIIDLTTYQLPEKAKLQVAVTGEHANVIWCPNFLLLKTEAVSTYSQVTTSRRPGVVYYEPRPEMTPEIESSAEPDGLDLGIARVLIQVPAGNPLVSPNM